ncbi:MAG: hypothetical protein APR63_06520 [Desulfuromonas sp. SDB]|nr:MAG: hypothetical protein APR63_06520 [Desulfuromonas sp. SDB]
MSPVVEVDKLSKWYGNILGIVDVSLTIGAGIKGLLGPNGAGKSTFLKLITGQLKPNIGTVKIFGLPLPSNPQLLTRVGYCPEYDSYYREMTGFEFIYSLVKLSGYDSRESVDKANQALVEVGLEERAGDLIKHYSLGMRQRLRIAQSIAHHPDLLILDEPLKGVDPIWRNKIINIIKSYQQQGKTVIVSSHILHEIEAMTEDIILINQGKVFAEGDIHYIRDLIKSHPHKIYVKTEESRKMAGGLINREEVLSINFSDQGLMVETLDRDKLLDLIAQLIIEKNIEVKELTSPDDNLQAVFKYLTER